MLSFVALLLQAPPAAAPPDAIVVTAQRLRRLRFSAHVDKHGVVRCKIKRSSGDKAFDDTACQAVHDCATRDLRTAPAVQQCIEERLKARAALLNAPPSP